MQAIISLLSSTVFLRMRAGFPFPHFGRLSAILLKTNEKTWWRGIGDEIKNWQNFIFHVKIRIAQGYGDVHFDYLSTWQINHPSTWVLLGLICAPVVQILKHGADNDKVMSSSYKAIGALQKIWENHNSYELVLRSIYEFLKCQSFINFEELRECELSHDKHSENEAPMNCF